MFRFENQLRSWKEFAAFHTDHIVIAGSAGIIWFGLVSIFSELPLFGAIRSGLWNGVLFLIMWLSALRIAEHIGRGTPENQNYFLAHGAAAIGIATIWALLSMASGASISDWFLEGPIEQIPFFDWLESLFDNTEEYFSSDPGWLAYRWVMGLAIYVAALLTLRATSADARADALEKRVQLLLESSPTNSQTQTSDHLTISEQGQIRKIPKQGIELLEGERDYVRIHAEQKQFLVRFPLKKFEAMLDNDHFVRIHRSRIVNINHIDRVTPLGDGRASLTLTNGNQIHTSRQGNKMMKEKWKKAIA